MAMRTEQHGNAFAKLNNSNLSDCVAPQKKPARLASSPADSQASKICTTAQTIGAAASWLSLD
jgi:hypothetical protein